MVCPAAAMLRSPASVPPSLARSSISATLEWIPTLSLRIRSYWRRLVLRYASTCAGVSTLSAGALKS
jgi:hypothetical protein